MKKLILLLFLCPLIVFGQCTMKEYNFSNPSRQSGSSNSVGAIYKYTGIISELDAYVTIVSEKNAETQTFDNTSKGYNKAFQPIIKTTKNLNVNDSWYVVYKIQFKRGNVLDTSCRTMTIVDLDGATDFQEQIWSSLPCTYSKSDNSEVNVIGKDNNYYKFRGYDASFNNIDTNDVEAMISVNYSNTYEIIVKVGGFGEINKNSEREYCLYFKSFQSLGIPLSKNDYSYKFEAYPRGSSNILEINFNDLATNIDSIEVYRNNTLVTTHKYFISYDYKDTRFTSANTAYNFVAYDGDRLIQSNTIYVYNPAFYNNPVIRIQDIYGREVSNDYLGVIFNVHKNGDIVPNIKLE
jgi:hypothetical protein